MEEVEAIDDIALARPIYKAWRRYEDAGMDDEEAICGAIAMNFGITAEDVRRIKLNDDLRYFQALERGYDGDDKEVWELIHSRIKTIQHRISIL